MNFTEEQQEVIDARGCNVLVSAAAGSGKTAVLVERIIQLITDRNAVDIDHLLVVTFTRAAAAQMKERITQAIEKKLENDPENVHLQRQETLIHNAQITTIDSFCQYVIRNNFNEIDLDPSYRVADEGEMKLLQRDVMVELLEKEYEMANPDFLFCSEYFSTGNNDKALEDCIMQLYQFSVSMPWPQDWLRERAGDYDLTPDTFDDAQWIRACMEQSRSCLADNIARLEKAILICEQPDGPYMYAEILEKDIQSLSGIMDAKDFDAMQNSFMMLSFDRLSAKKDDAVSPEKRELIKEIRGQIKKALADLQEDFFEQDRETILSRMQLCTRAVHELCNLTLLFMQAFEQRKKEKNVIDFSDMEHFALNILVRHEPGQKPEEAEPTQVAQEYRDFFAEILIDEYQDSNLVQELILGAIAREGAGISDRFMVGDVKQSIYRFRLARPEIFMEKLDNFSTKKDEMNRRIDLHRNFRSRKTVLDGVNYIFDRVMERTVGGVDYDADAKLQAGAAFPEAQDGQAYDTELLLIRQDDEQEQEADTESGNDIQDTAWGMEEQIGPQTKLNAKQQEAVLIAQRIKTLLAEQKVSDGNGGLRKISYRDIVILLRATSGWDDTFRKILEAEGIPAYVESKTGYFKAPEVQTLLQLLSVLDNPLQDIPLVSVMHSCLGNFSDEELAICKAADRNAAAQESEMVQEALENEETGDAIRHADSKFYDVLLRFEAGQSSADTELRDKLHAFLNRLREWRAHTVYLPVHELLQYILEDSGYTQYITAMPGGVRRRANVDMLLEKASDFEKTSFRGLFHFVRYIEQLEKYEVDYGEANVLDENADVVRIMSIHKSKGLEFPVVFVAGLSKKFNTRDTAGTLITDIDLGIGVNCVDPEMRTQCGTLRRNMIAEKMKTDSLGEELRVLYVAMTRAKEKLIMTASVNKIERQITGLLPLLFIGKGDVTTAGNYLGILLMALVHHPAFRSAAQECGVDMTMMPDSDAAESCAPFCLHLIHAEDIHAGIIKEAVLTSERERRLKDKTYADLQEEELSKQMQERFCFIYPHENYHNLYTKTTVTELKKEVLEEQTEGAYHAFEKRSQEQEYIPHFIQKPGEMKGAERGTAYHKVMELLDGTLFQNSKLSDESVEVWMRQKAESGRLPDEYVQTVQAADVITLLESRLGQRMAAAYESKCLYREKPFMMGLPANRVNADLPARELVLIQGIIDAWFLENEEIILLDYKTDAVRTSKELVDKYHVQLDYYKEALEKITGKKVKEKLIYSFALRETISV